MRELKAANSESITADIKDSLLRFGLPLADCRGQCYDGASVMSGHKKGVATKIMEVCHGVYKMYFKTILVILVVVKASGIAVNK